MYGMILLRMLGALEFERQLSNFVVVVAGARLFDCLAQRLDFPLLWPAQRDAPRHAVAHRAAHAEVRRRAGDGVPGALQVERKRLAQALFDQVGKFEILEKHVEELVLRKGEFERVLTRSIRAPLRAAAAFAAGRTRDLVASDIFLIARHDMLGPAGAPAVMKHRLDDPAHRDRHLFAMFDIGDLALAQGVLHR